MARVNMVLTDETEKALRIYMIEHGIKTFNQVVEHFLAITKGESNEK